MSLIEGFKLAYLAVVVGWSFWVIYRLWQMRLNDPRTFQWGIG
jgi:uncharacterized membrane protein YqjE